MIKLLTKVFSVILFSGVLLLNGCTDPVDFQGIESTTDNQYSLTFDILNVTKSHQTVLFAGDIVDVKIVKNEGELDVSISDSGNNYLYKGDDVSSNEFSVTIPNVDNYNFRVTGRDAAGSVSFTVREKK